MDCQDVLDQLADYLDRESREEITQAIEAHLSHCPDCKIEVDTLKKTIWLFHESDSRSAPPVPQRVSQQLAAALDAEYTRTKRAPLD